MSSLSAKRSFWILCGSVFHACLSFLLLKWSIVRNMEIAYRKVARTAGDNLIDATSTVLIQPLYGPLVKYSFGLVRGPLGLGFLFLNSLIWALTIWLLLIWLQRAKQGQGENSM
jgi:hypothetical protein